MAQNLQYRINQAIKNGISHGFDLCDIDASNEENHSIIQDLNTKKPTFRTLEIPNPQEMVLQYFYGESDKNIDLIQVICTSHIRPFFKPTSSSQLRRLIEKLCDDFGNTINLNWIDVSELRDLYEVFNRSTFNGDISQWDVSNCQDMSFMFWESSFNGDISQWDVHSVKNMQDMFAYSLFNGDISQWNVQNVEIMASMFTGSIFTGDISRWNVSHVETMEAMFASCKFDGDIAQWDVSQCHNFEEMFYNSGFTHDLSQWKISQDADIDDMLDGCAIPKKFYPIRLQKIF